MSLHSESKKVLEHIRADAQGKRIVFVSGSFNIIHPGHLRLLRFARECGDYLVVGVLDGRSSGEVVPAHLRLEGIRSISWVNYGFILQDSPASFVEELKPAFVVKGKEHEDQYNPEAEILNRSGGKLLFSSGDISFSSIDLMKQEWNELNISNIKKPLDFSSRHKFDFRQLSNVIDNMKILKVCVIGDMIVDEYITCEALGMSQEDPTIVVAPVAYDKFTGGAGVVAAHAISLGETVHLFSVVGKDDVALFARDELVESGVTVHFYEDESRPTTLKQRYRAGQKTLLRVSHLRQHAVNKEAMNQIFKDFIEIISDIDLLIFADFNYGCLPQFLVDRIMDECLKRGIMMVADSQSSSQVGDISRFKDMAMVTPTEREVRLSVQDYDSGLVVLAEKLRQKSRVRNVVITLAEEGMLIHAETSKKDKWLTDRLPSFNTTPKDVSGAGDSLLTCASMALAVGADIWQSSYLGSLAAASQIGRLGNIPITPDELKEELL